MKCGTADSPLTRGPALVFVEDEPYFVELQDPEATRILLTADYGASGEWPVAAALYGSDTSLLPDGRTRVLGYSKPVGAGEVAYVALGHCHNPAIHATATANPATTRRRGFMDRGTPRRLRRCCAMRSRGEPKR